MPPGRSGSVLALLAFLSTACTSFTALHPARSLPSGEVEAVGALGAWVFTDDDSGNAYFPLVEVQGRRGLGSGFDVGFKTSSFTMFQADLNWSMIETKNFVVSIDPTVSVMPFAGILVTYVWLPVLVDVVHTDNVTITASARIGRVYVDDIDPGDDLGIEADGALKAFGIGARIRFGDSFTLVPEIGVALPMDADVGDEPLWSIVIGMKL